MSGAPFQRAENWPQWRGRQGNKLNGETQLPAESGQ
jgi:hypothetical protein